MEADPHEHRVRENGQTAVEAGLPERQATNVAPMTWVLGVSITLTIVGFIAAWILT